MPYVYELQPSAESLSEPSTPSRATADWRPKVSPHPLEVEL